MATTTDPALRAWWAKQLQAREDAIGGHASTANRKRRAQEAIAQGEVLPPHISNLMAVAANSATPLRDEVRADLEAEIARRSAAHKEKTNA